MRDKTCKTIQKHLNKTIRNFNKQLESTKEWSGRFVVRQEQISFYKIYKKSYFFKMKICIYDKKTNIYTYEVIDSWNFRYKIFIATNNFITNNVYKVDPKLYSGEDKTDYTKLPLKKGKLIGFNFSISGKN